MRKSEFRPKQSFERQLIIPFSEEKSHSILDHKYGFSSKVEEHTPAIPPQVVMDHQIPSRTAYPTPARTEKGLVREDSASTYFENIERTRPTTMREFREAGQFSRLKEPTPGPYKQRARVKPMPSCRQPRKTKEPMRQSPIPAASRSFDTPGVRPSIIDGELILADIPDFGLRMKVAKLMAIAPGLPVKDLYDLLIEMKGRYEEAKDQVFHCVSQAPPLPVRPQNPPLAPKSTGEMQYIDEKEVIATVDFDNPDIYWDTDVPASPPPPLVSKKAPAKKKRNKFRVESQRFAIANTTPKPSTALNASTTIMKSRIKSKPEAKTARAPANIGVKRSFNASRSLRSNSLYRDFILIDDDSEGDSSYRDKGSVRYSEDEGSDFDIEEDLPTNLHIAMKRPFHVPGDAMDIDE